MRKPSTPFPVWGYFAPQYFCDREPETERILDHVFGQVPMVIIGVRRIGKTGLIRHAFYHLEKKHKFLCIHVDILGTTNLQQLTERLTEAILTALPEKKRSGAIWSFLKSLRPVISMDEYSGHPQVSFDFKSTEEISHTLHELFGILAGNNRAVTLALDEFQEILKYPDNAEAVLRSEMQQYPQNSYLFSGSQTHLLSRIFLEATRPFFGSTQRLYLGKISHSSYHEFIHNQFAKNKKNIRSSVIDKLLNWSDHHTYYTQYLCNQLFLNSGKIVSNNDLNEILNRVLKENQTEFFQLRELLPKGQWKLLYAIGKENEVYQITSHKFITKYDLDTPGGIRKALQSLLDKQLIYLENDESGTKYYKLSDVFMMRWIQNIG